MLEIFIKSEEILPMIEALRSDEIVRKCGGRFKLTALIQHRLREIMIDGARPLVERNGRTDLEVVIAEILEDKITPDYSESGYEMKKDVGSKQHG
jgi:DNA-directed RNA polymerase subunit omega